MELKIKEKEHEIHLKKLKIERKKYMRDKILKETQSEDSTIANISNETKLANYIRA